MFKLKSIRIPWPLRLLSLKNSPLALDSRSYLSYETWRSEKLRESRLPQKSDSKRDPCFRRTRALALSEKNRSPIKGQRCCKPSTTLTMLHPIFREVQATSSIRTFANSGAESHTKSTLMRFDWWGEKRQQIGDCHFLEMKALPFFDRSNRYTPSQDFQRSIEKSSQIYMVLVQFSKI